MNYSCGGKHWAFVSIKDIDTIIYLKQLCKRYNLYIDDGLYNDGYYGFVVRDEENYRWYVTTYGVDMHEKYV